MSDLIEKFSVAKLIIANRGIIMFHPNVMKNLNNELNRLRGRMSDKIVQSLNLHFICCSSYFSFAIRGMKC